MRAGRSLGLGSAVIVGSPLQSTLSGLLKDHHGGRLHHHDTLSASQVVHHVPGLISREVLQAGRVPWTCETRVMSSPLPSQHQTEARPPQSRCRALVTSCCSNLSCGASPGPGRDHRQLPHAATAEASRGFITQMARERGAASAVGRGAHHYHHPARVMRG